jgi:hypothetical protein
VVLLFLAGLHVDRTTQVECRSTKLVRCSTLFGWCSGGIKCPTPFCDMLMITGASEVMW